MFVDSQQNDVDGNVCRALGSGSSCEASVTLMDRDGQAVALSPGCEA